MINLKVGHQYLRRDGKIVEIKEVHRRFFRNEFVDFNDHVYYENGSYWSDGRYSEFDLLTEVKGE